VEAKIDYKYDALGNEAERDDYPTGTGSPVVTRYEVDGWNPALAGTTGNSRFNVFADLDGSNALQTRYVHGDKIDQLLARIDNAGNAYWTLTDRQGSVRDVIDNTGAVKDALNYDAFGNIIGESNSTYRGSYAWTGRELDVETDLQYNRARWYDPATARWMSQDPLGFNAGDSNLYRYVNNQPANAMDPSGLNFIIVGGRQVGSSNRKIKLPVGHLSLAYYVLPCDVKDPAVGQKLTSRDLQRYRSAAVFVESVELLVDTGWAAWTRRLIPSQSRRFWQVNPVGIANIVYNEASPDVGVVAMAGQGSEVADKWGLIEENSMVYPYAEQPGFAKGSRGQDLQHWINSYYIEDKSDQIFLATGNNSNTFVRYELGLVGLPDTEPAGVFHGANNPSPNINRRRMSLWVEPSQRPFFDNLRPPPHP
jgi:RHS repeat-associated protein